MEHNLEYVVDLPNDGTQDEGVKIVPDAPIGKRLYNIVINSDNEGFFQRINIYESGLITSSEVRSEFRTVRLNKPFTREGNELHVNL